MSDYTVYAMHPDDALGTGWTPDDLDGVNAAIDAAITAACDAGTLEFDGQVIVTEDAGSYTLGIPRGEGADGAVGEVARMAIQRWMTGRGNGLSNAEIADGDADGGADTTLRNDATHTLVETLRAIDREYRGRVIIRDNGDGEWEADDLISEIGDADAERLVVWMAGDDGSGRIIALRDDGYLDMGSEPLFRTAPRD